mmetsp:Transcript_11269/g.26763  ORF Transcript_11269/g.26763 Transcript_11269/m.26763 type:complete len:90 (-) Transcript_11269:241-510(-)
MLLVLIDGGAKPSTAADDTATAIAKAADKNFMMTRSVVGDLFSYCKGRSERIWIGSDRFMISTTQMYKVKEGNRKRNKAFRKLGLWYQR